jgi:hypothetical protein
MQLVNTAANRRGKGIPATHKSDTYQRSDNKETAHGRT